jgi:hypothetical protein
MKYQMIHIEDCKCQEKKTKIKYIDFHDYSEGLKQFFLKYL